VIFCLVLYFAKQYLLRLCSNHGSLYILQILRWPDLNLSRPVRNAFTMVLFPRLYFVKFGFIDFQITVFVFTDKKNIFQDSLFLARILIVTSDL